MDAPKRRENTFRIEFGHFPKKPNAREIHAFVGKRLGLTQPQVKRIQYNQTLGCAYVQCADLNTAQQTSRAHADNHEVTIESKTYTYKIRMEEAGTEVRIYDLSENISDEQVRAHMSQYGEVLSIKELMWDDRFLFAGIPSGIRLLRIVLRKHVESYITIMGESTLVTYSGQIQICRHCGELIHIGIPCTQNKKLIVQKMNINNRMNQHRTSSYAEAVKNKNPKVTPKDTTITTPVDKTPTQTTVTPATPSTSSTNTAIITDDIDETALELDADDIQMETTELTPNNRERRSSDRSNDDQVFKVPDRVLEREKHKLNNEDGSTSDSSSTERPDGRKMRSKKSKPQDGGLVSNS